MHHTLAGTYANVGLTASDGSLSDTASFAITVTDVNRPPAIDGVANRGVSEGQLLVVGLAGSDPDGDALHFSLVTIVPKIAGGVFPVVTDSSATTGTFTWTPTYFDGTTTYLITVADADGRGGRAETSFSVRVTNADGPPQIQQQPDTTIVEAVQSVIVVRAVEPDGQPMKWRLLAPVPPWAKLYRSTGKVNAIICRPGYASAESLGSAGVGKDSMNVAVWSGKGVNLKYSIMTFILTIQDAGADPSGATQARDIPPVFTLGHNGETALVVAPNPARGPSVVWYAVPAGGPVEIAIYATDGRLVRTLMRGPAAAGFRSIVWDGTDNHHRHAPAGVYRARITTAHGSRVQALVMER